MPETQIQFELAKLALLRKMALRGWRIVIFVALIPLLFALWVMHDAALNHDSYAVTEPLLIVFVCVMALNSAGQMIFQQYCKGIEKLLMVGP